MQAESLKRKTCRRFVLTIVKRVRFCAHIVCGSLRLKFYLSGGRAPVAPDTAHQKPPLVGNTPPAIGEMVSHYRIVAKLAIGGMSSVYRAVDTQLGRPVALKFMRSPLTENPDAVARFRFEARVASALNHPHICTVYNVDEYKGQPFLVMELLEGQTLQDFIGTCCRLPLSQALEISIQILDALKASHSKGIVHRDVKPANIFISSFGHAKLLDFGLATHDSLPNSNMNESIQPELEVRSTIPAIIGTAAYMSPEQARGWPLDSRSDLFSFGVVLYEATTGRAPFAASSLSETLNRIINDEPVRPTVLNKTLPAVLEKIILNTLKKDRSLRYQTAEELMSDLKAVKQNVG